MKDEEIMIPCPHCKKKVTVIRILTIDSPDAKRKPIGKILTFPGMTQEDVEKIIKAIIYKAQMLLRSRIFKGR